MNLDGLPDFDKAGLEALVPTLRALTARPGPQSASNEAQTLLREVGVELCIVPPIKGSGTCGATLWKVGHPIVLLSLRGKKDNQLWFTSFHELGHVLLHEHAVVDLQGDVGETEDEADRFASSTCSTRAPA